MTIRLLTEIILKTPGEEMAGQGVSTLPRESELYLGERTITLLRLF